MLYSIFGYEQKGLISYGLDSTDLVIINYLLFKTNGDYSKSIFENGCRYVTLANDEIANDLPFLGIKERGAETRINNLRDKGFIDKISRWDEEQKKKSYMRLTDLYKKLLFDGDNNLFNNSAPANVEKEPVEVEKPKNEFPTSEVIRYLNEKAHTRFTEKNKSSNDMITARFKEGRTLEDFKKVIDKKVNEWYGTSMQQYLRPKTLFNASNFESYLGGSDDIKSSKKNFDPRGNWGANAKEKITIIE